MTVPLGYASLYRRQPGRARPERSAAVPVGPRPAGGGGGGRGARPPAADGDPREVRASLRLCASTLRPRGGQSPVAVNACRSLTEHKRCLLTTAPRPKKQRSSFVYNSEDLAAVLHHALTDFYLYNNP